MTDILARAVGVTRHYTSGRGGTDPTPGAGRSAKRVVALDDVTLEVRRGLTTALVGESGSGKSTLGRLLLALEPPTSGRVEFEGTDLASLGRAGLRRFRRRAQIVFQDPFGSLNPRQTVGAMLTEALAAHEIARGVDAERRVAELLERVGLAASASDRYPHEFSGGQRQRIGIARALSVGPDFLVLDEPVSALDVSVQAQILNLLRDLQAELGLTYLFVSHDLSVVRNLADHVSVMRAGRIVEEGEAARVLSEPRAEYTRNLIAAVPRIP